MPATPRWLLAIPDAIRQLDALDRDLLTRRDLEQLFGVSRARAATLMQTFGAALTGHQRTLPRTQLLRQLRQHRAGAAFRGEATRRARLLTELRTARLTGIRVAVPVEALEGRLASLPEGVHVARDRICGLRRSCWRSSALVGRPCHADTCRSRSTCRDRKRRAPLIS